MIRAVKLEKLPAELRFPAELQHRISYDATEQKLKFDGFMSKTDFDRLVCLSNELSYQRSLEELFRRCTFEDDPSAAVGSPLRKAFAWSVGVAGISAIVAVWLLVGS